MALSDLSLRILKTLDPETAHSAALTALRAVPGLVAPAADPILRTEVAGLRLPNPVGLAAGFDKDAVALQGLSGLGFGFVECGSVTPLPQAGNAKPRLFRLSEDRAVINRMGFNNRGLEAFSGRLLRRPHGLVVGANLGANKDSVDKAADYVLGLTRLRGLSDYVTVNISSPNTPGLRTLQSADALDDLLGRLAEARGPQPCPLFLKIAPDLEEAEIEMIVEACLRHGLNGLIVSNTTLDRPSDLRSPARGETGGLSGHPLQTRARAALGHAVSASGGRLPLIAAGGVDSADEAYARLLAGASAVQIYSALVFEGPGLVRRINAGLSDRLRSDGFPSLAAAVGAAAH